MIAVAASSLAATTGGLISSPDPAFNEPELAKLSAFKTFMVPPDGTILSTAEPLSSKAVIDKVTTAGEEDQNNPDGSNTKLIASLETKLGLNWLKLPSANKLVDEDDGIDPVVVAVSYSALQFPTIPLMSSVPSSSAPSQSTLSSASSSLGDDASANVPARASIADVLPLSASTTDTSVNGAEPLLALNINKSTEFTARPLLPSKRVDPALPLIQPVVLPDERHNSTDAGLTSRPSSLPMASAIMAGTSQDDLRRKPSPPVFLTGTIMPIVLPAVSHAQSAAPSPPVDAQPASIAVDTPALGAVGAEVTRLSAHDNTALHVRFAVERASTAALIADGAIGLDRALTAAGLRLDTVSVEVRENRGALFGDSQTESNSRPREEGARHPPAGTTVMPAQRSVRPAVIGASPSNDRFA